MKLQKEQLNGRVNYKSVFDSGEKRMAAKIFGGPVLIGLIIATLYAFDPSGIGIDRTVWLYVALITIGIPLFVIGIAFLIVIFKTTTVQLADDHLIVNNQQYNVNEDDTVIFSRNCYYHGSGSDKSKIRKWKLLLGSSDNPKVIVDHNGYHNNDIWVAQLAEEIAEYYQLPLIDKTGIEPLERKVGTTDRSVLESLSGEKINDTENVNLPDNIDKQYVGGKYQIEIDPSWNLIDLIFLVNLMVLTPALLVFSYQNWFQREDLQSFDFYLTSIFLLGLLIVLLFLFNELNSSTLLKIDQNKVEILNNGNLVNTTNRKLDLTEFEYILPIKLWNYHTIEFIGDHQRYIMPGEYSKQKVVALENVIKKAIISQLHI